MMQASLERHEILGVEAEALSVLEHEALERIQREFPDHRDGRPWSRTAYGTTYIVFAHGAVKAEGEESDGVNLQPGFTEQDARQAIAAAYEGFVESFITYAHRARKAGDDLVWRKTPVFTVYNMDSGYYDPPRPEAVIRVAMRARFCFERPIPKNPAGPLICVMRQTGAEHDSISERVWGGVDELTYVTPEEIEDLGEEEGARIVAHMVASEHWHLQIANGRWHNSQVAKVDRSALSSDPEPTTFFPDRIGRIDRIGRY